MTAYLVRHGHAGNRHEWHQPDDLRPLSKKGRREATAIAELLDGRPVDRVVSSPTMRCRLTVEPLADRRGMKVELADELIETADPAAAMALLGSLAGEDVVLCSHGEIVKAVVRRLVETGTVVDGEEGWSKGSTWVLERDGDRWTTARWLPPPG